MSYRFPRLPWLGLLAAPLVALSIGCTTRAPDPKPAPARLPKKEVAEFLKGTVWELVDVTNSDPLRVSGFGLVVGLDGTGDTRAPNAVREYMIKTMQKHGFGSSVQPGFEKLSPEMVLNDPLRRTAIVRVDGFIPPGARKNEYFDVQVSALENSNTTSLHRGSLYQTELSPRGGDPLSPGAAGINPWARVSGPIFVNPLASMDDEKASAQDKVSLRHGVVMGRGVAADDRPIILRLRDPQPSLARAIERRIEERFQDSKVADAKNENATPEVWVTVPAKYADDWERFIGVCTHLYFNPSSEFAVIKARQLVEIAKKDREKAPLMDISYCWEAMTPTILPEIRPLYLSDSPDVSYAAARAGAFLGDPAAEETLFRIARAENHPFQLNAVRVLGQLPASIRIATGLRELLDTNQLLLRIEAYRALLSNKDRLIYTQPVLDKFALDVVPSKGPPILYATRTGTPRIAIIGNRPQVAMPVFYLGLNRKLSITSDIPSQSLKVFYRTGNNTPEASVQIPPDIGVLIARLGGLGGATENGGKFTLTYGEILGVLQQLSDGKLITDAEATTPGSQLAVFQMQVVPGVDDPILSAVPIPEQQQRPTTAPATAPTALPGTAMDGQRPTR